MAWHHWKLALNLPPIRKGQIKLKFIFQFLLLTNKVHNFDHSYLVNLRPQTMPQVGLPTFLQPYNI
jgi:hypothetical protein